MIALSITDENVKTFMNVLLKSEAFDLLCCRQATIASFVSFDINGQLFSEEEDKKEYCKWSQLRPFAFDIIKNGKKPSFMKYVFSAADELRDSLSDNAAALFINITFQNGEIMLTGGYSQRVFSMDKHGDAMWDEYICELLKTAGINYQKV